MSLPDIYTAQQVEEIAHRAVQYAVEQLMKPPDLENGIQRDVVANIGGETMASNHKERYYFTTSNGEIECKVIYGKDKKETDFKFKQFLEEQMNSKPHAPLLVDFVNNSYRKSFMRKLAPTTVTNYNNYIDRYILPVLGDKHMDMITVEDVQLLYDWMAQARKHGCQKNLVHDTISRVSGLLSRLFHIAIDMKLVTDNPVKKTLLSNEGEESSHHTALLDEEVTRVKQAIPKIKNEQQRLYMGLLAYTGMRREEIAGLGWEHINLDEAYGSIVRTVTYPDGKKAVIRNKTKTKRSTRDFIIPDALIDILKPCAKSSGYIIHGRNENEPASPSTIKRLSKNAFQALGISDYNNHDWRTTFGTQLKDSGLTSAQVADLLGHADTRMVEKVYAPTRHQSVMKHKELINMLA